MLNISWELPNRYRCKLVRPFYCKAILGRISISLSDNPSRTSMTTRVIQSGDGDEKVYARWVCWWWGRLLIDIIWPHILQTHRYCIVDFLFSVVSPFYLLCLHGDSSVLNVCNTHARCMSPVSSIMNWSVHSGFPLEVHLTLLQVGFQLVFVAFPLPTGFPLPRWKLGVQ